MMGDRNIRHGCLRAMAALSLTVMTLGTAWADNEQAHRVFALGQEQLAAGNPGQAGHHFERARFYADDPVLKANALKAAAAAFRETEDPVREAAALRELTANFANQADYVPAMRRQYELASADYRRAVRRGGSWFPWHGQAADRAIEAYESLLAQAQFAEFTPELRVRLGRLYLEKNRIPEALQQWRDVTRLYPGSAEERYAWFELANALVQLAASGDGDGAYGREAQQAMDVILEKYSDDPDTPWARDKIRIADTLAAQRLYDLADFYRGTGNHQAAIRYLHELLATYPHSPVATDAERLLVNIDRDYIRPATPVPGRQEVTDYPRGNLPEDPEEVLVPVGKSGGKWLIPVEDLGLESWRRPQAEQ